MLWAKNIDTGELDWKPVSKIYIEHDRGIYHIRLKKLDSDIINIEATDDHPFYIADFGWKTTVELQIGDNIETKEAGHVVVVSVEDEHRKDITYNFEIADFHTYYVTEFGVLVHNCPKKTKSKKPVEATENDAYTGHGPNPEGKKISGKNGDKHTNKRSGKRTGVKRNNKKGRSNKKYIKPVNPNKKKK